MKITTRPRRVKNILTMMKSYNIKIGWILLLSFISLHLIVLSHKLKGEAVKSRKRILIQNLPLPPDISSTRSQRFPSIDERTRLYMSNWYIPPCTDNNNGMIKYQYNKVMDAEHHVWDTLTIHESNDVYSYYKNAGSRSNDTSALSYVLESIIEPDTALFLDFGTLQDCTESMEDVVDPSYEKRIKFRHNMYMYCLDSWNLLVPAVNRVRFELEETKSNSIKNYTSGNDLQQFPPIIVQFGDLKHSHKYQYLNVPHFKKFRSAAISPSALDNTTNLDATARINLTAENEQQQQLECYPNGQHRTALQSYHVDYDDLTYYQPIVWKLASRRHFMMLPTIRGRDVPWGQKTNQAVFYGQLTGSRDIYNTSISQEANCYNLRRCRLVYESAKSKYVHARLTNTRGKLPKVLNGVELVSKKVDISYLLTFKGIIMLEGNGTLQNVFDFDR